MNNFDKLFSTKDGIDYILKNRNIYKFSQLKIKVLIKLHLYDVPNSKLRDRKQVFQIFKQDLGELYPASITTLFLTNWLRNLKIQRNYSEKTMSHIKCMLNHFFKWLYKQEAVQKNPILEIKFKQNLPPQIPRRFFNSNQIQKILYTSKNVSAPRFYTFLYSLVHTGARRMELLKLDWKDVDLENDQITFRKTKNGSDRTINIPPLLKKELSSFEDISEGPVFRNEDGYVISRQRVNKEFKKLKEVLTEFGNNWACHSMRHSYAYNFLRNGGEMYQLKAILGHKSIKMTVDLYGNLKSQDVKNPSPYNF